MWMKWILILLSIFVGRTIQIESACGKGTLRMIHVLFRHGDRTSDSSYPKDPYKNFTYPRLGFGQLTNKGKEKEYNIGSSLNNRYKCILDMYTADIIDAVSTDTNRTKMSLELVLAGLFPPKDEEIWNPHLNWQPIPYRYTPQMNDHILGYPNQNCPAYLHLYEKYVSELPVDKEEEEIFQYVSESTGLRMATPQDMYYLYFILQAEQEWGFKLPNWTESVWPEKITRTAIKEYFIRAATDKLKKLSGGFLLKKIVEDTVAKMKGTLIPPTRKVFMYSGHEYNVALLLTLLNVYYPHVPPYGAYIVLEVHQVNGIYGFKVLYQSYINDSPMIMQIPGCPEFCPIQKFVKLMKKYFPIDENDCNMLSN